MPSVEEEIDLLADVLSKQEDASLRLGQSGEPRLRLSLARIPWFGLTLPRLEAVSLRAHPCLLLP